VVNASISRAWLVPSAIGVIWLTWLLQLPPRPDTWLVVASGLPLIALGSRIVAARNGEAWRALVLRTVDFHVVWLALLVAFGIQFEDAHGITTDGVTYFAQLRSVIFDHDLDVEREFAFLQQPPRPGHIVPIGPIPVWLPLYLSVAAVDAVGRGARWWTPPADPVALGLTLPYVRAALVSSFAIAALGVIVMHILLRREFSKTAALAATLLVVGGTSLFWYMVYEPSMTHAASFGFIALFATAVVSFDPRRASPKQIATIGVLLGLAFITRPQEAVFAILPALYLAALPDRGIVRLRIARRYALWGALGLLPLLILQLAHSYVLFSREHLALVGEQGFLNPFRSRWTETLWSSWHGFLSWTPVAYIAVIGTAAYGLSGPSVRRNRRAFDNEAAQDNEGALDAPRRWPWAVAALLIVFVMAWINGATPDLGAGWSFGGRRFVSCLVLLAPGLAWIAQRLLARPLASIAVLAAAFLGWNYLLIEQYRTGLLPNNEPVSFAQLTRQQAQVYTRPPYFYPFAFPANALFAWRTGLPIDRYDLLGTEPLQESVDVQLDDHARRLLLDGWGAATGDSTGSGWWTAASPASLVLPLKLARDGGVRVDVDARSRLTTPAVRSRLAVVVNGHVIGTFAAEAEKPSAASFHSDRTMWIDGFNRVSFVSQERFWPVAVYRIRVRTVK